MKNTTKRLQYLSFLGAFALAVVGFSQAAHADNQTVASGTDMMSTSNGFLGVEPGLGILSNGAGSHLNIGATLGYKVAPEWMAAAFYNYIGQGDIQGIDNSTTIGRHLSLYGLEGDYNLGYMIPGTTVGGKVALGTNSVSTTIAGNSSNNSSTNFYFGPKVAYDYPLNSNFTVGGEANILFSPASNTSNIVNLLAVLKYWV